MTIDDINQAMSTYFRRSRQIASYKPILLQGILYNIKNYKFQVKNQSIFIALDDIAIFFIRFNYVLQKRFKLKQLHSKEDQAKMSTIIENEFQKNTSLKLKVDEIPSKLISDVKKLLNRHVIWALRKDWSLHNFYNPNMEQIKIKVEITTESEFKQLLGQERIEYLGLDQKTEEYVRVLYPMIEKANLAVLVDFLDSINVMPKLFSKLLVACENFHEKRNISPEEKQKLFQYQANKCFYCEQDMGTTPHADHFIPYDYLLDSPIWNMVGACVRCNLKKHAQLVNSNSIEKLKQRNQEQNFHDQFLPDQASQEEINTTLMQHYTNCALYYQSISKAELVKI